MLCKTCKIDKPVEEFYEKRDYKKNWLGRHKDCKVCLSKKNTDRVKGPSKEDRNAYMRKYLQDLAEGIRERPGYSLILEAKAKPCTDCGQCFPPECMDLDHVIDGKTASVSAMRTYSEKRVVQELAKCETVCANCHRIRTKNRLVLR